MTDDDKTIERLNELLDLRDAKIEELQQEVEELEQRIRSASSGWMIHYTIEDKHPELPLPRLEIVFTPNEYEDGSTDWGVTTIEYRLVRRHLLDHLEVVPLGETVRRGSRGAPWPTAEAMEGTKARYEEMGWEYDELNASIDYTLPCQDGAHAGHDSAHLGLPLYVETEHGMKPYTGHLIQRGRGLDNRRPRG